MAQSGTKIAAVRETRKGATIHKTNERPGTRAQARYVRVSAYKAREVLDLIRGKHIAEADEILQFTERGISDIIRKALASAVANATNNDGQDPEALFVSACFADEGPTLKRWRPRARGRATRIRKRTCHITIIVSRLSETALRIRTEREASSGRAGGGAAGRASRRARVAQSKRAARAAEHDHDHAEDLPDGDAAAEVEVDEETMGDGTTEAETLAVDAELATTDADVDPSDPVDETDDAPVEVDGNAVVETDGGVADDGPTPTAGTGDIKGNADSMKYHVPGSQWYEQTEAEAWFETVEEAEAAGYEPAGGADKQDVETDEKDEN